MWVQQAKCRIHSNAQLGQQCDHPPSLCLRESLNATSEHKEPSQAGPHEGKRDNSNHDDESVQKPSQKPAKKKRANVGVTAVRRSGRIAGEPAPQVDSSTQGEVSKLLC